MNIPPQFTYHQHHGGTGNDCQPVNEREAGYIEHLSTKLDYQNLTKEDQRGDKQELLALAQPPERTVACQESFRIEEIPKLQHHEEGEEIAQFVAAAAR